MISPIDAFNRALFYVSGLSSRIFDKKPGAVIERMSEKDREALQNLKSSEIDGTERLNYIVGSEEYYQNKEFEKDKLEFDKKILKD